MNTYPVRRKDKDMANSREFKMDLLTRITNVLGNIGDLFKKANIKYEPDDEPLLLELNDFYKNLNSEEDFDKINDDWFINKLSLLIKMRKKYETKTNTKITGDEVDYSREFHISLFERLKNDSFWKDGDESVANDYVEFFRDIYDALTFDIDEDCLEEALKNYDEEWLIYALSRLAEIWKEDEKKKKTKTKSKKTTSSEKVKYTSVVIKRKVQIISSVPIEIDINGEVTTKLDSGQVKEISVPYGKKYTLFARTSNYSEKKAFMADTDRINFIVQQTLFGLDIEKVADDKIDISEGSALWEKVLTTGVKLASGMAEAEANRPTHAYQCRYCGQLRYGKSTPSASQSTGCPSNRYRVHMWNKVY